jgi:iron complex transport system substrate-binding protein
MFRKSMMILMAVALWLTACTTTQTDDLNRNVKLQGMPRRIVSLAPSNTEILFAVGAGKQVVGRDSFSDYPPEARSAQDIGGSMNKYDTEAIVALHPDLVLAGEINTPELVASLEQLGLTVYYLSNPTTLEEMYANLETVGRGSRGCQDRSPERPSGGLL